MNQTERGIDLKPIFFFFLPPDGVCLLLAAISKLTQDSVCTEAVIPEHFRIIIAHFIDSARGLWLIMIKHTDTKLHIDLMNINAHKESKRTMSVTRRNILIFDDNRASF